MDPALIANNVIDGVLMGMLYSLIALGLALIFGVMDIINFAHGDFVMIAAYLAWVFAMATFIDPSVMAIITVPLFFVIGLAIYKLVIEPVLGAEPLIQIAVTVGLGYVLQNMALAVWKAEPKSFPDPWFNYSIELGPISLSVAKLLGALISAISLILIHYLLTRTKFGLAVRATSANREVAPLMGISVKKVYGITFGIGTALTALGAALYMAWGQTNPYLGASFSLLSWVIVAMGGLGGVIGVFFSGLIVGVLEAMGNTFVSPSARLAVVYLAFFLILWFRPRGLFAKR
ncbi:MAG: branched-chain amino acid ABC transporter permease [Thermoprotei archaeon]|nr:MAG: branched-chain amino acid ABC transporter permease [Thermoprotei archaeon]